MPNYYAHLKFGDKVLSELPLDLAGRIGREEEAFHLGCLGPDPLFFYHPIRPNGVRREGVRMHRSSALPAAERLRRAIEDGVPMAAGYGAGFLCHLALDSACHGYVDDRAADGPISHMAIEGEYDRVLMARDGLDASEKAHLPETPADRAVWEAASQAFVHASPDQLRRAYRSMNFYSGFLARSNGRARGRAIGAVSRMLPIPSAKGIALREEPHPSSRESSAQLDRLLEGAVAETAEQLTAFFRAIEAEAPVPDWFNRDFKGNPPRPAERVSWSAGRARSLPVT